MWFRPITIGYFTISPWRQSSESGRGLGLPYNSGRIVERTLVRAALGYDACAD
jgi:hypothetical protein